MFQNFLRKKISKNKNMSKGNTLKFLEGAAVGLALGVAANMFLDSKKGKALKNDIESIMADFYKYASPKVKKIKKLGEKEYKIFMKGAAENYAKLKKISGNMAEQIIEKAQESWESFSNNQQEK
ncbi:MAG: hypothetical protein A2528_02095 [Candidatus Staskawiczbacteria bacterium RIFOXYD2_FULL_37_9]|uniref:YtxH domain-containing protein n=1 Tax=Candidatus Staskawiczbacteria bacterium RIFOXYB1_FULL_37_44 TaxID=1802223 RepID=A0A1G2IVB1_9BACT|nr:MAG: hypothetical protein A2358_02900 [Candidatus Staskawiczbacteria bacterium RIFOXYB1_FULL_37_44]OGZ83873.1 MAG: hypothetical protein A2416_02615 [Candidatus Staskawiczbacteria bacterium RIFOXYC1_FULL_37_52]OGZ87581.1 MAG: hypothetical protein A2444_03760 [Candidatus Staskawiczbacteria bacterium RIFOXYC2_FULL_37_19]OGZ89380.1 MAG: hypothetical protein A2581_00675 [Candidatus Staskawiczbacteria bacterium RIFOXYD1_FULL_37_110]OGZ94188.1 MAG: hypothetical protein A2528_02095 [Candidatus Stask